MLWVVVLLLERFTDWISSDALVALLVVSLAAVAFAIFAGMLTWGVEVRDGPPFGKGPPGAGAFDRSEDEQQRE